MDTTSFVDRTNYEWASVFTRPSETLHLVERFTRKSADSLEYRITVEAKIGVVTLEGTAAMDEAVEVARSVSGVREVKTQQVDIPPIPPFVA